VAIDVQKAAAGDQLIGDLTGSMRSVVAPQKTVRSPVEASTTM